MDGCIDKQTDRQTIAASLNASYTYDSEGHKICHQQNITFHHLQSYDFVVYIVHINTLRVKTWL